MTSTRDRQRAAARARLERDMAQRAAQARKRRQTQAMIGAGAALLLVIVGTVVLVKMLGDDDEPTAAPTPTASASAGAGDCIWSEVPKEQQTKTTKNVGLPPAEGEARTGTQVMTIATNFGDIKVTMNLEKSPCTAANFAFLASKNFFDGTKCHRMFPGMLQCGDPSAKGKGYRESDGTGGPSYRFPSENLPTDERPPYPEGVVAMANSGPDTNGSQFFFIYEDVQLQPDYTVVGKMSKESIDVVKKATAKGHDGAFENGPGGGHPKEEIIIKDLTVAAPAP